MKTRLPLLLTLTGSLFTLAPALWSPTAAKAQDDTAPIGLNAPHQERSGSAALSSSNPAAVALTPAAPRPTTAKRAGARALVAANTVVVVTAPAPKSTSAAPRGSDLPFETLVGANAPRQERNPSQHPELFGATAGQRP